MICRYKWLLNLEMARKIGYNGGDQNQLSKRGHSKKEQKARKMERLKKKIRMEKSQLEKEDELEKAWQWKW